MHSPIGRRAVEGSGDASTALRRRGGLGHSCLCGEFCGLISRGFRAVCL